MGVQNLGVQILGIRAKSRRWDIVAVLLAVTVVAAGLTMALLSPAQAQFWSPFGAPRRPPALESSNSRNSTSSNTIRLAASLARRKFRAPPAPPPDNSHAPAPPAQRKAEGADHHERRGHGRRDGGLGSPTGSRTPTRRDPDIAVIRKHRTGSGLIRYDPRRDVDWAQTAREIIAAEKPKYIVMMVRNQRPPGHSRACPGASLRRAQYRQAGSCAWPSGGNHTGADRRCAGCGKSGSNPAHRRGRRPQ